MAESTITVGGCPVLMHGKVVREDAKVAQFCSPFPFFREGSVSWVVTVRPGQAARQALCPDRTM